MKKFIGTKDFYKQVFVIIIPIMLQQLLMSIAGYIDNLMINSYGVNALAYNGVSAANRMIFVCNFVIMGFSATASIFIAQYLGAKNKDKINESVRLSLYVGLLVGLGCFLAITLFGKQIVNLFIQDEDARNYGYQYLSYIRFGMILASLVMTMASNFRCIKRPRVALIVASCGIVVNVFFNYCLIYGHFGFNEMGAGGAALATDISRAVELSLYLILMFVEKKSWFYGCFKKFYVTLPLVKVYIKKAIPLVFNECLFSIGSVMLARYCTYKNDTWYNAYAYAQNISELFFIVFAGLGNGTAIVLGSALGNDEFEEAEKYSYYFKGLAIMMGASLGILMLLLSPAITYLFKPSPEVKGLTINVLRVTAIFMAVYCYDSVCFFILRAGGDAIKAFILDQSPTYLIGIPLAIIFGVNASKIGINLVAVYLITHAGDVFKIFLATFFVSKKTWIVNITKKVEEVVD